MRFVLNAMEQYSYYILLLLMLFNSNTGIGVYYMIMSQIFSEYIYQ